MNKKALNIVKNILVWTLVVFTVFIMIFTIFSVNTFDKTDRDIFGYKFFIVLSDSMSDTFRAGDVIISKEVDPSTLVVGDIITYISQADGSYNEVITHKIRSVTTNEEGDLAFITYGTTAENSAEELVSCPYILGKYSSRLPWIGHLFQFMKTTEGYVICILVPFLLLIIYNGFIAFNAFRRYKQEEMKELDEEKKKLEEERRQSLEMMAELQKLKEQLASQQGGSAPATAENTSPELDTETNTQE